MRGSHRIDKSKLVDKIYMLHQLQQQNIKMSERSPKKYDSQVKRIHDIDEDDFRKAA
ncbi:MAG: hypothetical protein CLLPBCKN_000768 [Chroococcidiopsis cubana SAG 39.79]|jgi:hypothetical protein|uniref:Uncharacterized protein n=1 Tax=Chroococcidiopsis cubana SAG 39.79 TaxID=388085 RepID=A0AB37UCK3_9CYAN|nr:hypothetical protein [Chroococcidiopsis cubana SAG 39.79]RUT04913.1 hypothetical protein DSM107010_56590 [Chroococcidiopsis cubana SAG 39.79]